MFSVCFICILLFISTIVVFAQEDDEDDPIYASYQSLPSMYTTTERNAIITINCKAKPSFCEEEATYQIQGLKESLLNCPRSTKQTTWEYIYNWYDQDMHLLTRTRSKNALIIPNPFTQIDPEQTFPDILYGYVRIVTTEQCEEPTDTTKWDPVIINGDKAGKFVITSLETYTSPKPITYAYYFNPWNIPNNKVEPITTTFAFRFPQAEELDQRKRLSWRFTFPPQTNEFLHTYNKFSIIPMGLAQFPLLDDAKRVLDNVKCVWGDNIASHLTTSQYIPLKNDDVMNWGLYHTVPTVDQFTNIKAQFQLDCTASLTNDKDAQAWWINEEDVLASENSIGLRFQSNIEGKKDRLIVFRPENKEFRLNVVNSIEFDEFFFHEFNSTIVVPTKTDKESHIMTRLTKIHKPFDSEDDKKKDVWKNVYSVTTEFAKFGRRSTSSFQYDTLARNHVALQFSGPEINQQGFKITVPHYTILCQNEVVIYGSFQQDGEPFQIPGGNYPTYQYTINSTAIYNINSTRTLELCTNTTTFDVNYYFETNMDSKTGDYESSLSTILLSSNPQYKLNDTTHYGSTRTHQFTVVARQTNDVETTPDLDQTKQFVLNDFLSSDLDYLIPFNTLRLDLTTPFISTTRAINFKLSLLDINYYFIVPDPDSYNEEGSLKCKFNDENVKAILLTPTTLIIENGSMWPDFKDGDYPKLLCPGLYIKDVNINQGIIQHDDILSLAFTLDGLPTRVQYTEFISKKKSYTLYIIGGIALGLALIAIIVIITRIIIKRKNENKQPVGTHNAPLLGDDDGQYVN